MELSQNSRKQNCIVHLAGNLRREGDSFESGGLQESAKVRQPRNAKLQSWHGAIFFERFNARKSSTEISRGNKGAIEFEGCISLRFAAGMRRIFDRDRGEKK
jgi:hypothetical protein